MSYKFRFYSFVANLYLSPLQQGLQTSHVQGEISGGCRNGTMVNPDAYVEWEGIDKTIIICAASNHRGVKECFAQLEVFGKALHLPHAIFHEDEDSMNGMATGCGIIVPEFLYGCRLVTVPLPFEERQTHQSPVAYQQWEYVRPNGVVDIHHVESTAGQFLSHIKSYRLA